MAPSGSAKLCHFVPGAKLFLGSIVLVGLSRLGLFSYRKTLCVIGITLCLVGVGWGRPAVPGAIDFYKKLWPF